MKPNFIISEASETDIPDLVALQYRSFSHIKLENILAGPNTPENQALSVDRQTKHLHTNSGLTIVKVEVVPPPATNAKGSRIIGLCMFYLPNEDATTPQDRVPTPLRTTESWITAPLIKDNVRRQLAEKILNDSAAQMKSILAGLDRGNCGYVSYMAVDPEYRRQGIGRMLMEFGTRLFDARGVDCVLRASDEGLLLYRHFGFEVIGVVEIEIDQSDGPIKLPVMVRKTKPVLG